MDNIRNYILEIAIKETFGKGAKATLKLMAKGLNPKVTLARGTKHHKRWVRIQVKKVVKAFKDKAVKK